MVEKIEEDYFGEDDMPELFDQENREKSRTFKYSLLCFTNVDNHFFMLLFMVLCTVNLMGKMFYLKMPKKL